MKTTHKNFFARQPRHAPHLSHSSHSSHLGFIVLYLGDPGMPLKFHDSRYFEIVAPQDATRFPDESAAMHAASKFNVGSYSISQISNVK